MRLWLLGAIASVATAVNVSGAVACSSVCVSDSIRPVDAAKRGEVVFVGASEPVDNPERPRVAVVRVIRSYGRPLPERVNVASGMGSDCVPYVEPNRRFLFVFVGQAPEGVLSIEDCTYPLRPVDVVAKDIKALDKRWRKQHR